MELKKRHKTIFLIAEIALERGIKNPHQLHQLTGINPPRASRLWKGQGWLGTEDIDLLCEKLRCKVKDIIQRVPNSPDSE